MGFDLYLANTTFVLVDSSPFMTRLTLLIVPIWMLQSTRFLR